tara:strand:- start:6562 stop:6810 length:249 start_codon:yes stop_codon:yes gene_type:complete
MIQRVDFYEFVRAFEAHDRGDSFSELGFRALYDHLEDEDEMRYLDVIEIDSSYYQVADGDTLECHDDFIAVKFDGGAIVCTY